MGIYIMEKNGRHCGGYALIDLTDSMCPVTFGNTGSFPQLSGIECRCSFWIHPLVTPGAYME